MKISEVRGRLKNSNLVSEVGYLKTYQLSLIPPLNTEQEDIRRFLVNRLTPDAPNTESSTFVGEPPPPTDRPPPTRTDPGGGRGILRYFSLVSSSQ